jgi:hypothetical protein
LKKCSPPNRSGRVVAAASSVMQIDESVERGVAPALLVHVLDNRLDDEVARRQLVEGRRPGQVRQRRVPLLG